MSNESFNIPTLKTIKKTQKYQKSTTHLKSGFPMMIITIHLIPLIYNNFIKVQ